MTMIFSDEKNREEHMLYLKDDSRALEISCCIEQLKVKLKKSQKSENHQNHLRRRRPIRCTCMANYKLSNGF